MKYADAKIFWRLKDVFQWKCSYCFNSENWKLDAMKLAVQ
jgi:hypothetical protein